MKDGADPARYYLATFLLIYGWVKLFSAHLVLISLFLIAPDLPRLVGHFFFNLPVAPRQLDPCWARWRFAGPLVLLLKLLFVGTLTFVHVSNGIQSSRSYGILAERSPLSGIDRVTSFTRDGVKDRELDDELRWVRLGLNAPRPEFPYGMVTVQVATGHSERMSLQMDPEMKTIAIYPRGGKAPLFPMTYSEPEPGVLEVEGRFLGDAISARLEKQEEDPLLTGRGFRWVNEYPFNR